MLRFFLLFSFTITTLPAAPLAYDRLVFPSDVSTTSRQEKDFGLAMTLKDGVAILGKRVIWKEKPEAFLEKYMELMRGDKVVTKKNPDAIASGKSKSSVPFVAQSRVMQRDKETLYAIYYGFIIGDTIQPVTIMADNPARFKSLVALWSPLLDGVALKPEDKPSTATTVYEQTGPGRDQFVSGVIQAESGKLTPVSFNISGAMQLYTTGLMESDLMISARDANGDIYLTESIVGTYAYLERAQGIFRISNFSQPRATEITRLSVMNLFKTGGEKADPFFLNIYPLHQLQSIPGGLLFGIRLEDHNGFMSVDQTLKKPAFVAKPSQLSRISFGWHTEYDASKIFATQKGNAWLFVMGPEDAKGKNYSTSAFFMTRQPDGGWAATKITPMLAGKPVPRTNLHAFFKGGCVDHEENFVNDYQGFLYRLTPRGEMIPVGRLGFPTKGVGVTGPAVTANGDIWYALTTTINVTSGGIVDPNGNYEHKNTWFSVGDRSRLIRLRPGKNGFTLGEISSESIIKAINAKGIAKPIDSAGLWNISHLLLDHKTGGLLINDSRNRVLFSLKPGD